MLPAAPLTPRQLWNHPATTTSTAAEQQCTAFVLRSLDVIALNPTSTITLTTAAIVHPDCSNTAVLSSNGSEPQYTLHLKEPFHSSLIPQVYATAAATVIAWLLVVMLLITPRTFFVPGARGNRPGLMSSRGMISGASGSASMIGVGSRPWLQKIAALTVAISLSIATADTFEVTEKQYNAGYMDAFEVRYKVVAGLEIKISRVISNIFLWLAQVQTLIRLFPRHKEKVLIKWVGFGLIMLDTIFSCLDSFLSGITYDQPRQFSDAIPALAYLFRLSLSLLYAAWVLFYSITKRRYAFHHPKMWNMSLIAILSNIAVLTPVVFFILDISDNSVAGWGDYFRWVGAAAASVIVWEWVERIEAVEREDKKDGILGREVFDGDEMLEVTPSYEIPRSHSRNHTQGTRGPDSGGLAFTSARRTVSGPAHRLHRSQTDSGPSVSLGTPYSASAEERSLAAPGDGQVGHVVFHQMPTPPPATAAPGSRTDTGSAASTVYAVRYHPVEQPRHSIRHTLAGVVNPPPDSQGSSEPRSSSEGPEKDKRAAQDTEAQSAPRRAIWRWDAILNPFRRRRSAPPAEVLGGQVIGPVSFDDQKIRQASHGYSRWDLKSRLGAFAADLSETLWEKTNGRQNRVNLPVTIIPAQPRGRTWSPDALKAATAAQGVSDREIVAGPSVGSMGETGTAGSLHPQSPPTLGGPNDILGSRMDVPPVGSDGVFEDGDTSQASTAPQPHRSLDPRTLPPVHPSDLQDGHSGGRGLGSTGPEP